MQPSEAGEDVCTLWGWAQSQWRKQVPRELCPQDQDWTQGPVTAAFPAPQPPPAPWLRVTHSRAGGGRKEPGGGRQEGRGWVAGPSPAARSSSSAVTGRRTPARRRAGAEGGQEAQPPGGAATASPAQPGTSEEVRSEDMSCWTKHEILRGRSTLPRTWMGLWAALSSWVATGPLARDKEANTSGHRLEVTGHWPLPRTPRQTWQLLDTEPGGSKRHIRVKPPPGVISV